MYDKNDRAIQLLAELKMIYKAGSQTIQSAPDAMKHLLEVHNNNNQECFYTIYLNGAHAVLRTDLLFQGTLDRSIVHPREVFAPAVELRAKAIIIAHNHPSGSLAPSIEDNDVFNRIKDAGNILGILVLDQIIFNEQGAYYSFLEEK